jgi:hypothetical protein
MSYRQRSVSDEFPGLVALLNWLIKPSYSVETLQSEKAEVPAGMFPTD